MTGVWSGWALIGGSFALHDVATGQAVIVMLISPFPPWLCFTLPGEDSPLLRALVGGE